MTSHSESVVIDVSHLPMEEASRAMCQALAIAIEKERRFTAVVVMPALTGPKRSHLKNVQERIRMLKQIRPGLEALCAGLAFVATRTMQSENKKSFRAADRMWGCPTDAFETIADAENWAHEQLAKNPGQR